ncbi:putative carboxyphosphonoenolpyruvate phosphonomutase [Metarhizium anisopliae]
METTAASSPSAASKFRHMLATKDIIVAPGVYDGFSAQIALETGAGICASKLGQADLGLVTLNDMRSHAEMMANLDPKIPLIADADTGYGGANMVACTAKRCGYLGGKAVVDTDTFVQRIRAAAQARRRLALDIVVIARTDALQTDGFDEAVRRLKAAAESGADVAFLEGIQNDQQAREVCRALAPVPVLLNMVEHGATPSWTPDEARQLGFKIIFFPFAVLAPVYKAIRQAFVRIKETGRTGLDPEFTPKRLFTIVGLEDAVRVEDEAGGSLYDGV